MPNKRDQGQKGIFNSLRQKLFILYPGQHRGFPGDSVVKNLPANAGNTGWIPESGRSPEEGLGKPFQYSCLENRMDRGAWWATGLVK